MFLSETDIFYFYYLGCHVKTTGSRDLSNQKSICTLEPVVEHSCNILTGNQNIFILITVIFCALNIRCITMFAFLDIL